MGLGIYSAVKSKVPQAVTVGGYIKETSKAVYGGALVEVNAGLASSEIGKGYEYSIPQRIGVQTIGTGTALALNSIISGYKMKGMVNAASEKGFKVTEADIKANKYTKASGKAEFLTNVLVDQKEWVGDKVTDVISWGAGLGKKSPRLTVGTIVNTPTKSMTYTPLNTPSQVSQFVNLNSKSTTGVFVTSPTSVNTQTRSNVANFVNLNTKNNINSFINTNVNSKTNVNTKTNVGTRTYTFINSKNPISSDIGLRDNIFTNTNTNVPVETMTTINTNINVDVPVETNVFTPTPKGGFIPFFPPGGGFGSGGKKSGKKQKTAYQASFDALLLGKFSKQKPTKGLYTGFESRAIIDPTGQLQKQYKSYFGGL